MMPASQASLLGLFLAVFVIFVKQIVEAQFNIAIPKFQVPPISVDPIDTTNRVWMPLPLHPKNASAFHHIDAP